MTEPNKTDVTPPTPPEKPTVDNTEELVDYTYNGKSAKLPKELVDSFNKRLASETHTLKEKYKSTSEQVNALSVQLEEMKLSQMTEAEKKAHEDQKRKEKEEALERKANDYSSKYKNYFLDTELHNAISGFDVVNSKQVLNLIKAEFKSDFIETDEGINIVFKSNGSQLTVQEAVKTFLQDPANANLIKSSLIPGSGTRTANTQTKTNLRTTFKRSEVNDTKSDAAKEYREAMRAGLNPSLTD